MKEIVLVGTCHTVQIPGGKGAAEFCAFVETLCAQYGIKAIGEEYSEEALAEKDKTNSVCRDAANTLNVSHRYCDPGRDQRRALGVSQENDIKVTGWLNGWPQEKIEQEISASHSIREHYWRDQLASLDLWPALFICGAEHTQHFRSLLEDTGYSVLVVASDWEPLSKASQN